MAMALAGSPTTNTMMYKIGMKTVVRLLFSMAAVVWSTTACSELPGSLYPMNPRPLPTGEYDKIKCLSAMKQLVKIHSPNPASQK